MDASSASRAREWTGEVDGIAPIGDVAGGGGWFSMVQTMMQQELEE